MFGEFGLAGANIAMLHDKWKAEKQKGIIKVNHRYAHQLKTSLLFINRIRNNDAIIKSIGMSGILKKAQARYLAA
jgi:RNase P/RNase MRP subunit POP5